jgi:hypothetical protein
MAAPKAHRSDDRLDQVVDRAGRSVSPIRTPKVKLVGVVDYSSRFSFRHLGSEVFFKFNNVVWLSSTVSCNAAADSVA